MKTQLRGNFQVYIADCRLHYRFFKQPQIVHSRSVIAVSVISGMTQTNKYIIKIEFNFLYGVSETLFLDEFGAYISFTCELLSITPKSVLFNGFYVV